MSLVEGNKENFKEVVLAADTPVLVDFNAEWCGPCRALEPTLEELSKELNIVSVNIDDNPELAEEYSVSSIPCLVRFDGGKETSRSVGLISKSAIERIMK